jgi:hypothetical protein
VKKRSDSERNNLHKAISILVEAVLLLLIKRNLRLGRNNMMTEMREKKRQPLKEREQL